MPGFLHSQLAPYSSFSGWSWCKAAPFHPHATVLRAVRPVCPFVIPLLGLLECHCSAVRLAAPFWGLQTFQAGFFHSPVCPGVDNSKFLCISRFSLHSVLWLIGLLSFVTHPVFFLSPSNCLPRQWSVSILGWILVDSWTSGLCLISSHSFRVLGFLPLGVGCVCLAFSKSFPLVLLWLVTCTQV